MISGSFSKISGSQSRSSSLAGGWQAADNKVIAEELSFLRRWERERFVVWRWVGGR